MLPIQHGRVRTGGCVDRRGFESNWTARWRPGDVEPVRGRALVEGDWAEIQFRGEIKPLAQT